MVYWRMQLHPDDPENSTFYSAQSLAVGFIGLDLNANKVGDLEIANTEDIPKNQRMYVDFARKMQVGDRVLIISHHFPFAVCTVKGEYNYIKNPQELGVWFRHFRRVNEVRYFADHVTDAKSWEQIKMTGTIGQLVNEDTASLNLIRKMYGET